MTNPKILDFQVIGNNELGFLQIAEVQKQIDFEIKRIFWTHSIPNSVVRGYHAHKETKQILIAVKGEILVTTEIPSGEIETFKLCSPQKGLFLPANTWHTMQYFENAIQLVICSEVYSENDYLRNYNLYKEYYNI